MPRKKKEMGRPSKPLPPRVNATPEQLAQVFLALPANYEWKYITEGPPGYRCVDCERAISYPETLYDDGRCEECHAKVGS